MVEHGQAHSGYQVVVRAYLERAVFVVGVLVYVDLIIKSSLANSSAALLIGSLIRFERISTCNRETR